jgi:hypothetical protein
MTPNQQMRWAEEAFRVAEATLGQLQSKKGSPLQFLLKRAKADSIEALITLIDVDPNDAKTVMALQNEARRFRDLIGYLQQIIAKGDEAYHALTSEERDDFLSLVEQEGLETE